MESRTTILHVIDSLGSGGAENLLLNTVNNLKDYHNIVVYCSSPDTLASKFESANVINLDIPVGFKSVFKIRRRLREIVEVYKVNIIHSHSYWPHIITRSFAKSNCKVLNTYHSAMYDTHKHKFAVKLHRWLDVFTYNAKVVNIAVSEYIASLLTHDLNRHNVVVLLNFVADKFYSTSHFPTKIEKGEILDVVMIGNIKQEKNYELIIEAFDIKLKNDLVKISIYGTGNQLEEYRERVKLRGIKNIQFMGSTDNVFETLKSHQVFCMSSRSEACPLSPIEAMGLNMPLILSDIPALKEIAGETAYYFENENVQSFIELVLRLANGEMCTDNGNSYSEIMNKYSKEHYLNRLNDLYSNVN